MIAPLLAVVLAFAPVPPRPDEARRQAIEHHRSGQELMRSEHFEEAANEFKRAIELDPMMMMAHYNLGQAYMALKAYPQAVEAYLGCEEAVTRLGNLDQAALEERDRQNRDEIQELRNSLQQMSTLKNASVDSMTLGIEERIRVLENMKLKGREAVRVPGEVYLGLGSAYFRQNKLPEAESAYTKAVAENGKLGAAHNNLAVIYMLSGRYPEAHASIKAAEKAGFRVNDRLKADLKSREDGATK